MDSIRKRWRNGGTGIYCVFLFPLASLVSMPISGQNHVETNLPVALIYCLVSFLLIYITNMWSRTSNNMNSKKRANNSNKGSNTLLNSAACQGQLMCFSIEDLVVIVTLAVLCSGRLSGHPWETIQQQWPETSWSWILLNVALLCLVQLYIPHSMPGSFTPGEAAICSQILVRFICKCIKDFIINGKGICLPSEWVTTTQSPTSEDVTYFIEVSIFSCLLVIFLAHFIPILRNCLLYYTLICSVIGFVSLPILFCLLQRNFVVWLYLYILADKTHTQLFFYWCFCFIVAAIVVCLNNPYVKTLLEMLATKVLSRTKEHTNSKKTDNDPSRAEFPKDINMIRSMKSAVRKQFHLLAVVIFLPGIMYDVEITGLAIACALQIFIMIEGLRVLEIPPIGYILKEYLHVFVDDQDEGNILLTPMYLLAGCGMPLLVASSKVHNPLALYSGLISVGIGDTVASLVGSKYGHTKWPGIHKSVEGTIASIIAQFIFVWLLSLISVPMVDTSTLILAVVGSSLLEAYTTQIDNIILPFAFYILINM